MHCYCINLTTRKDRYESSKNEFAKDGLEVEYHIVDKHPKGGSFGCWESHGQVLRKIWEFGDDIKLQEYSNQFWLSLFDEALLLSNEYDIFHLSYPVCHFEPVSL